MTSAICAPRVAVVGGSLAGLSAAVLLQRRGAEVHVFEKRADLAEQVGGGIVVQKAMGDLLDRVCPDERTSISLPGRQFLDENGSVTSRIQAPQNAASWSSLWGALRRSFAGNYCAGAAVTSIEDAPLPLTFAGGAPPECAAQEFDFIVVADGGSSGLRKQLLGDDFEPPTYTGYVAWRGVVPEEELASELREQLMGEITFFHGDKTHILFYPIPVGDSVALNWVWYWNLPEAQLPSLLKDSSLGKNGIFSVPPGMLGEHASDELIRLARLELPANLCRVVESTRVPFLQPIVDYKAPRLLFQGGKVVLLGDAGCVLRPHTTYGTAKAVEEAEALCDAIFDGPEALHCWERQALQRNEELTQYAQFLGRSQQNKDAREKLRALQGQRLDSSGGAAEVIAKHGGA